MQKLKSRTQGSQTVLTVSHEAAQAEGISFSLDRDPSLRSRMTRGRCLPKFT